jgi:hypothetical protein
VSRSWERWLKGNNPLLQVTFDAACAAENRTATFVMPIHPLAQQAAHALHPAQRIFTAFRLRDTEIPAGKYAFAVYQWQKNGIRADVSFHIMCQWPVSTEQFMALLEQAETLDPMVSQMPPPEVIQELDRRHYADWLLARRMYQEESHRIAEYRLESLRTSHTARMAILKERLARVTDERVRRIPQGEIAAAEADFARQEADIEQGGSRADIITSLVAVGMMIVDPAAD